MSIIHNIASFSQSGLHGMQACQRDWSPYLVHFTSAKAMKSLCNKFSSKKDMPLPQIVSNELTVADDKSNDIALCILRSGRILKASPNKKEGIPECVCLSECNLPGLLSHSERYGRVGFVFSKSDVFKRGGRPCIYLDKDVYGLIDKTFSKSKKGIESKLFGLANVYCPPGNGKIQDFTHEREWRLFDDLELKGLKAILAPIKFCAVIGEIASKTPVIPIDMLHEWGA